MKHAMLLALLLAPFCASAVTPFAPNLKGLKYLLIEVNGDAKVAKKAGYPFDAIHSDLKKTFEKAGLKVVRKAADIPGNKKGLPGELILGMVNQGSMYSYALTLQVYEPMRIGKKDHLYVAWSSLNYGFGTQANVQGQLKAQVKSLADAMAADYRSVK